MAATMLPESPDAFKDASWRDVLPYYEELSSVARTVVVLQGPHSGCQVVLWVAKPRATEVDEAAEATVLDQDVGQAVIAMDEHVALARPAERAAGGVDRVNLAKDLAQPACDS